MLLEYKVKILEIIQRNYNVKSFRTEIPADFSFQAGQFISVTLCPDPQLKRYLSLSNAPTEKGYLEFTKKLTASDFSRRLDKLKVTDEVIIQGPWGKFILDASCPKVAFLSGGIGITPIRSICRFAADKNLEQDIILLYANRAVQDIVFRDDFSLLEERSRHFKIAHILCETEPGFICTVGRINSQIIKNEIPDYAQRKFYLCGPPQMVEAMRKILAEELLLMDEKIVTENFQGY